MNKSMNKFYPKSLSVVLLTILVISACNKTEQPLSENILENSIKINAVDFDFTKQVGWLHGKCLAIKNSKLVHGTGITMIKLGEPQAIIETKITGEASAQTGCFALFADRIAINKNDGRHFYSVTLSDSDTNMMAIGLVGGDLKVSIRNNMVVVDLDKDGVEEVFSSCSTREGMKFFVNSTMPNQVSPLWSDYYYLGYDVEPTCPQG